MDALKDIVSALYGFSVGIDYNPTSYPVKLCGARDKVMFIGEVYHNGTLHKIRAIKVARAVTNWNLPQTKQFLDECERIYLGTGDIIARLDSIIEENKR